MMSTVEKEIGRKEERNLVKDVKIGGIEQEC